MGRHLALLDEERHPGDAPVVEIGADHRLERPLLQMRPLQRGVEDDPTLAREPAAELDVLDRRVRISIRVERPGSLERLAPHGSDARPERVHLPG